MREWNFAPKTKSTVYQCHSPSFGRSEFLRLQARARKSGNLESGGFHEREKFQVVMNRMHLAWWRGVLTSQAGKGGGSTQLPKAPCKHDGIVSSPVIVFPFILATENISYSEDLRSLFPGPGFREEQP